MNFPDIKKEEARHLRALQSQVSFCESLLQVAERVISLRDNPGFQEYQKQLRKLYAASRLELEHDDLADSALREKRGEVRAYNKILALIEKTESSVKNIKESLSLHKQELDNLTSRGVIAPSSSIWR